MAMWTVRKAAQELGITRAAVYRRAEALGIGSRTDRGRLVLSDDDLRAIAACDLRAGKRAIADATVKVMISASDSAQTQRLYTLSEVARMLGVTRQAVHSRVQKLGIGVKAEGGYGRWLTEDEVAWLKRI